MNDDNLPTRQSATAEFRAAVLGLCADISTRIADLVEKAPASALHQCFDGSEHSPLAIINTTTQLCDMLVRVLFRCVIAFVSFSQCNLEPDPDTELVGTPSGPEYGHPELPDGDHKPRLGEPRLRDPPRSDDFGESHGEEHEPEAIETQIHVSDDVDWSVEIDVHRHAEPAIDPAAFPMDGSDTLMTEEADFPPPALPPKWTKEEKDVAMKLLTQTSDGDASHRWFQKIAVSLPNKTSNQVSEFYDYCSANHLL
ncbi:hypothetical protein B0H11DRAFT_2058103 [Mycena galericulata]|nr:hypothetical protein B0H11DRAFT_2058103 [Mycena galericulata]